MAQVMRLFLPHGYFSIHCTSLLQKIWDFKEVIDIGSGDGRIAYCAKILALIAYSIEIDDMLVDLQKQFQILLTLILIQIVMMQQNLIILN